MVAVPDRTPLFLALLPQFTTADAPVAGTAQLAVLGTGLHQPGAVVPGDAEKIPVGNEVGTSKEA